MDSVIRSSNNWGLLKSAQPQLTCVRPLRVDTCATFIDACATFVHTYEKFPRARTTFLHAWAYRLRITLLNFPSLILILDNPDGLEKNTILDQIEEANEGKTVFL